LKCQGIRFPTVKTFGQGKCQDVFFYRFGGIDSTAIARLESIDIDYPCLFLYKSVADCPAGGQVSASEHRHNMNRKAIKQLVSDKGIEGAMRIKKGTLTPKMRKFAEAVALGNTGADSLRIAYNSKAKPKAVGDMASRLKADARIKSEIQRIERANELAALHSAAGLHSIVISTLAEIATNPEAKDATRIQAVRSIGQLVGVDAFRATKRVEHVKDSGEIRAQILDQLRTITMQASDAQDVDASALLTELVGGGVDESAQADPTVGAPPQAAAWDSGSDIHSNPHEPSSPETTPISSNTPTPRGDILEEKDDAAPHQPKW
jgi:hypothetical protein